MKKALYILIGLVLIGCAAGFFFYQQTPEGRVRVHEFGRRYAERGEPQRERSARPTAAARDARRGPAGDSPNASSGLQTFELAVNLLNVAVGIIGIWLAFVGTRMQRQAMSIRPGRDE